MASTRIHVRNMRAEIEAFRIRIERIEELDGARNPEGTAAAAHQAGLCCSMLLDHLTAIQNRAHDQINRAKRKTAA